ncbi:MAG TPA: DUF3562 domain-containing protein [Steroidobacteraceae bacterium]|jgi:hypothetical protein|nr:DUF3562 domain-containing protein [Steroidobacteraceae bacterium]
MNEINIKSNGTDKHLLAMESLARETSVPIEEVESLYQIERAELEMVARITIFVPLLTAKHVRRKLQEEKRAIDPH